MNIYGRHNSRLFLATIAATAAIFSAAAQAQTAPTTELMAAAATPSVFAETAQPRLPDASAISSSSAAASLPDAPGAVAPAPYEFAPFAAFAQPTARTGGNPAPKYTKYIPADETGVTITAGDKVVIGLRDLVSPLNFIAMIASAGYEQATNGSPNYGTNSTAFGKRFGAAVVRESSQGLFTDSVFAPILHMDPRYYTQGPDHSFIHRTVYAVTRVLVSKTDSGRTTINAPLLLGYAASTGLNNAYYPQINRNFKDTASEYGGSLGGAAIGFFVSEFSDSFLKAVHLKSR
jgi:hypothetical protein